MEAAASDPLRFRSLILSATCSKYILPGHLDTKKFSIREQIQKVVTGTYSDQEWLYSHDERFPSFKTNHDRMVGRPFLLIIDKCIKLMSPVTFIAQLCAVFSHNVSPDKLKAIGENIGKVYAVSGELDNVIDPKCSEILCQLIPGCIVHKIEGKGHGLPNEAEHELIGLIDEVINGE
jgi:pimeloyl-ACP methyl ester carboxylesterase